MTLDLAAVRSHFPALAADAPYPQHHLHNAGGSFACAQTIDALTRYYTATKAQPDANYASGAEGAAAMTQSRERWATALNVPADAVGFGPSTSQNTYVLANAFRRILSADDAIVVTDQDHESNTGVIRYAAEEAGAEVREWRVDPDTGLLDPTDLEALLDAKVKLVCFPHVSNITGEVNDASRCCAMARAAGAWSIVDGVAYVPHAIPDVTAMGADVYLFSLYKVYSVHQGLMTMTPDLFDALPNQGHFFKAGSRSVSDRFAPAGPDHAQVAAAGAVLDYVEALDAAHGGSTGDLRASCERVSTLWKAHEHSLTAAILDGLAQRNDLRIIGTSTASAAREPMVAFHTTSQQPAAVAQALCERGFMCGASHFYAHRLVQALGIDPDEGVVRLSLVHYNTAGQVDGVLEALDAVL